MPYDDSNIKKMVKDQLERKVGFSKSKRVSEECKNLVYRVLEVNIKKRATIANMYDHPWLSSLENKNVEVETTKLEKLNSENAAKINLEGVKTGGKK